MIRSFDKWVNPLKECTHKLTNNLDGWDLDLLPPYLKIYFIQESQLHFVGPNILYEAMALQTDNLGISPSVLH